MLSPGLFQGISTFHEVHSPQIQKHDSGQHIIFTYDLSTGPVIFTPKLTFNYL